MKKQDFLFAAGAVLVLLPLFLIPEVYSFYDTFNREHGIDQLYQVCHTGYCR